MTSGYTCTKENNGPIDASNAVSDFCKEEYIGSEFDERLGTLVLNLCKTAEFRKEFTRLLKLKLQEDELIRLVEIFDIMIQINEQATDPVFAKQFERYMQIAQQMYQKDITEEKISELNLDMKKECPLIDSWLDLCDELKAFQDGLSKGVTTLRLDHILAGVVKGIKKY